MKMSERLELVAELGVRFTVYMWQPMPGEPKRPVLRANYCDATGMEFGWEQLLDLLSDERESLDRAVNELCCGQAFCGLLNLLMEDVPKLKAAEGKVDGDARGEPDGNAGTVETGG